MNCPNCGTANAPEAFVCSSCGTALVSATPSGDPTTTGDAAPNPFSAPTQAQPEPQPPAGPTQPYGPPPGGEYAPPGTPSGGYPGAQPPPGAYPPGAQPPGAQPPPGYAQQGPPPGYPPQGPPPGAQPPPGYPPQGPPPGYPGAPQGPYPGAQPPGFGPPSGGGMPPYPPGMPPQGGGGKGNRTTIFALLGVLLVVAIGAAAFIVMRDDETGTSVGASILLEPVSSTGTDPFSDDFDEEDFAEPLEIALEGFPDLGEEVATALAGRVTPGTAPGLYGGSQETGVCRIEELISFLTSGDNSAKAEAWASTLGIETGGIEEYVRGLTPVRLRFDTRVTNHGFRDGQATAFQSILQAGTGVLVDDQGIPRVKCNCGNPLLEPEPLADVPSDEEDRTLELGFVASNPDDAWEGLDPKNVTTIESGEQAESFTLIDLESGRFFERPVGTNGEEDSFVDTDEATTICEDIPDSPTCAITELGSGDVQLTLEWGSEADLDLHVFEPDGTEIYWSSTTSPSGGSLDLDSNAQCAPGPAVEHIVWPEGQAPSGDYRVVVDGFDFTQDDGSSCGSGDYTLTINVGGEETVHEGTVGEGESQEYEFSA